MNNFKMLILKSMRPLISAIAVGSAVLGLLAALGASAAAAAELSLAVPKPQFDMHSSANVKFLADTRLAHVPTSDAWLSNGMGKIHVPVPHMNR